MNQEKIQLFRKGSELRDPEREARAEVVPANPNILLPMFFSMQKVVVPRGEFLVPIDLDGTPLKARLESTQEMITVYPELRLVGVENLDGGQRLAKALYNDHEQQLPALRLLIDGIFRGYLGHNPAAEQLDEIAKPRSGAYKKLQEKIALALGLVAEWTLQPEPKTADWLAALVSASPRSTVVKYNTELASMEFRLAFSISVERASLVHLNVLQRRAGRGLSPEQEFERLFARVYETTIPAFRTVWAGVNVWNTELVRAMAVDGFAKVVADKLTREFGYVVRFSDFTPELSDSALEALRRVAPDRLTLKDFEDAEGVLLHLKQLRRETLTTFDGDYSSVAEIDQRIARAQAEMVAARDQHLTSNDEVRKVLGTVQPAMLEDMRQKFRSALLLEDEARERADYGGKP